jgi:hypothetical protein
MINGQKKMRMRRASLCVAVLMVFGFVFTASIPKAFAAGPEADFIAMYKAFFQDLQEKKYDKVWDAMTEASKQEIAKEITDALVAAKKEANQAVLYDMLEKDTSNFRTNFFDNLYSEYEKLSFFSEIKTAEYSIKSSTKERVVLTITVTKKPKDFQILKEQGKWKINFYDDLSR